MVGFFFTGSAVIGILVSQFLAGRSDKRGDRKSLIVFCCLLGVLACTLFAWNRNYFVLLFVGVFLSSFGSTANPQMFALAREHADKTGREAVMISALFTRSGFTGMGHWPTAGLCVSDGFQLYGNVSERSGSVYCLRRDGVAVFTVDAKELPLATGTVEAPRRNRRDTLLLFVICTLMWGSNSLYIINMPLFIINELHLPEKLAGVMMGTAAGLEIPTMLIAGYFAKRLGKRFLMRVAAVGGVCFYAGMLMAHSPVILLGFAAAKCYFYWHSGRHRDALFSGSDAGQAGSATTLYTNTSRVGWIIAGSVAGIVAEIWNYHAVFWFAMVMIIATLFCLLRIKDV